MKKGGIDNEAIKSENSKVSLLSNADVVAGIDSLLVVEGRWLEVV